MHSLNVGIIKEDLSSHDLIIVGAKKRTDSFTYRSLYLSSQSRFRTSKLGSEKFGDELNATSFHRCLSCVFKKLDSVKDEIFPF